MPARSLLGLAVGWFVGALVILVSGTPALEVPLDGAVRAMAKRGFAVTGLTVVRPAGSGPLILSATTEDPEDDNAVVEMYGPHQRSGGALRQAWLIFRLRGSETAPLQASMRRAVEHRALMAIAIGDGVANTSTIAVGSLEPRLDAVRAQARPRGAAEGMPSSTTVARGGSAAPASDLHGDLRDEEIHRQPAHHVLGGFGSAGYSADDLGRKYHAYCNIYYYYCEATGPA